MRIHTEVKGWHASYRGKVYYRLVCPETNESIEAGTSNYVTLNSSQRNEPQLTAAKIDLTRLTPERHYEIHVEIDENGKRREIWTNDSPRAQIMVVKGNKRQLSDTPVAPIIPPTPDSPVIPIAPPESETPKATHIVLDSQERTVAVEEQFTILAKVMPEKANQQLKWTLNNTDVLQHLGDGRFKALKAGEAIVTITTQDGSEVKAECHIKVERPTALLAQQDQTQHSVRWEGTTLVLQGVKSGALVRVFSLQGKILFEQIASGTDLRIDFQGQNNILFVETTDGLRRKVVR